MISVKTGLPRANTLCYVTVASHLNSELEAVIYKFVECSDGHYFWDSSRTVLQDDEVVSWEFA